MSALDDPRTSRLVRRGRRSARVKATAGLVLLVAFVVSVSLYGSASDALRDHGVRTVGTIDRLYADTGIQTGHSEVTYPVARRLLTENVDLGSDADNYDAGQQVTVYYDRSQPTRMTIDDEDNQPEWTVWFDIAAFVGGLVMSGVGIMRSRRWTAIRRVAARGEWHSIDATIRFAHGRMLVTSGDDRVWRSARTNPRVGGLAQRAALTICARPDKPRAIVAVGRPDTILLLQAARTPAQAARWSGRRSAGRRT